MAEALSPLQKKIHPLLTWSFRGGLVTSVFIFLFGMAWRAGHIEAPGGGDAEKQKQEIAEQQARVNNIDKIARDLNSVTTLGQELWQVRNSAARVKDYMKGPKLDITYDMDWLQAQKASLEKQLKEASLQSEIALIHSAHISERDFIILSQDFMKSSGPKQLTWLYRDKLEGDYPMTHVNGLHECQKKIAAEMGAAQTEKSAAAIITCAQDTVEWRKVAQRSAMGGAIFLGFMGRRLRKKWDKVAAQEQIIAGAAPVPSAGPVIVTTAQPVTMKPIKIKKAVA